MSPQAQFLGGGIGRCQVVRPESSTMAAPVRDRPSGTRTIKAGRGANSETRMQQF